jgi:hypothetical protein
MAVRFTIGTSAMRKFHGPFGGWQSAAEAGALQTLRVFQGLADYTNRYIRVD